MNDYVLVICLDTSERCVTYAASARSTEGSEL